MQRYGYEGYPVVENDKVVGLLTRARLTGRCNINSN